MGGVLKLSRGNKQSAVEGFDIVNQHHDSPQYGLALLELVQIGYRDADYVTAVELARRMTAELPDDENCDFAIYLQGLCLAELGRVNEATTQWSEIHLNWPDSCFWQDATVRLAKASVELGDLARAAEYLDEITGRGETVEINEHALYARVEIAAVHADWQLVHRPVSQLLAQASD